MKVMSRTHPETDGDVVGLWTGRGGSGSGPGVGSRRGGRRVSSLKVLEGPGTSGGGTGWGGTLVLLGPGRKTTGF